MKIPRYFHEYDLELYSMQREALHQADKKPLPEQKIYADIGKHLGSLIESYKKDPPWRKNLGYHPDKMLIEPEDPSWPQVMAIKLFLEDIERVKLICLFHQKLFGNIPDFLDVMEFRVCEHLKHLVQRDASNKYELVLDQIRHLREKPVKARYPHRTKSKRFEAELKANESTAFTFKRIDVGDKLDQVVNFFNRLAGKNSASKKIYMNESAVRYFLRMNFEGFEQAEIPRKLPCELSKGEIRYLVYKGLSSLYPPYYSKKIKPADIATLIQNSFEKFTSTEAEKRNIQRNMSRRPKRFPTNLEP